MKQDFYFLGACFAVFFFFSAFYFVPFNQDSVFHYAKAKNDISLAYSTTSPDAFSSYPPLSGYIGFLPALSGFKAFAFFWDVLVPLFFVLFLYFLFRNTYIFVTIFCVPFLYASLLNSLFAQFLCVFFWVSLIYFLEFSERKFSFFVSCLVVFVLSLLMFFSHNMGLPLAVFTVVVWLFYRFLVFRFPVYFELPAVVVLANQPSLFSLSPLSVLLKFLSLPLVYFFERRFSFLLCLLVPMIGLSFFWNSRVVVVASVLIALLSAEGLKFKLLSVEHVGVLNYVILIFCFAFQLIF